MIELKLLNKVKEIAREAGDALIDCQIHEINEKTDVSNIVTDMDVKTQAFIIEKLTPLLEGAEVFAEEKENQTLSEGYTWVIDPIDGTTNFAYNFQHSAISIGLIYKKETVLGVCYNPYLKEMFSAVKGHGAYCNDVSLRVSQRPLASSLVMCGTSPYYKDRADATFTHMKDLFLNCRDLRRSGSAVLDLCYVASGRVDAFYEELLSFWDYAAASLLILEAGGSFEIQRGSFGDLKPIGMIAGNPLNLTQIKEVLDK